MQKEEVSAIRYVQANGGWRLRPADLNDIDGYHALAANPLVYQYLFDGVPPDKEYITRLLKQSVVNAGQTGLVCGSWKRLRCRMPVLSTYDPIHLLDPRNSPTCWNPAIGDKALP
jgi:hypothetical protein